MIGQVDVNGILAATVPLAVAIIGGGLAMAWRLGGLERTVKDLGDDVKDLQKEIHDNPRPPAAVRSWGR